MSVLIEYGKTGINNIIQITKIGYNLIEPIYQGLKKGLNEPIKTGSSINPLNKISELKSQFSPSNIKSNLKKEFTLKGGKRRTKKNKTRKNKRRKNKKLYK